MRRIVSSSVALLALVAAAVETPQALRFERVWEGRNVLDADIPFPDGVTFVPGAEYRAEVRSLPAAMRIVDASGAALATFAAWCGAFCFDFKFIDSTEPCRDPLDWYDHGVVEPLGRVPFVYKGE